MSTPDILANMAQAFDRSPASVATGTQRTGVAAAVWMNERDDVQEARGEPDQTRHIICVPLTAWPCEMFLDDRLVFRKRLQRGAISLVRSGLAPRAVLRSAWKVLHLYIPDSLVRELLQAEGYSSQPGEVELIDPKGAHDPVIDSIGRDVMMEMRGDRPLSRLRMDALGQSLVVELLRRHSNLSGTRALALGPLRGGLAHWQLHRITAFVNENLGSDLGLSDLASLVDRSPLYFARAFKRATGVAPHQYVVRQRVERAKHLLRSTDLPLAELALACGFADQSHFSNSFKRFVGATPTMYRRGI